MRTRDYIIIILCLVFAASLLFVAQGRLDYINNARRDMNSDVAALYIESLNEVTNVQAQRVAIGLQARVPAGIWLILWTLVILGMIGMGYQTAIAGSRRSWAMGLLAISFSLVIALITSLDRPQSSFIPVSQQPLADLQATMAEGLGEGPGGETR